MSRADAVNTLMREWRAGEQFRDFFTRMVDNYMGSAKNVLASDLQGIREAIHRFTDSNI